MPEYRHPLAGDGPGHPPARVHVSRAENAPVAEDGTFEAPEAVGQSVAARFDMAEDALRVDDNPETVAEALDDGRCPWCDDYDGDHVASHASSAHPDEWAAHTEDDE